MARETPPRLGRPVTPPAPFALLLTLTCVLASATAEKLDVNLPIPYFDLLPPVVLQTPAVKQCCEALQRVPDCASNILVSFITGNVTGVGADCCTVFEGIGLGCVSLIFPFVPLNPWFGSLIHGFCSALPGGGGGGAAPPPYDYARN